MDDQPATQFYESVYEAMLAGNVARLEQMTHLSSFPCGTDGWLGEHWLCTAIGTGNEDAVAWVLGKGAVATYVDDCGSTALRSVLQLEGDYNQNRFRDEKLSQDAVTALIIRIIDRLVEAGIDVNQRVGALNDTALHSAAAWSSPAVIEHLLARGADPCVANDDYGFETPADIAKSCKKWDAYRLLCAAMG